MATITGFTSERMLEIEGASVVGGKVVGGNLILTKQDGSEIPAGPVVGPPGPSGPVGPGGTFIPGEIRLWAGSVLPTQATYGTWVWADGGIYVKTEHPLAAANISVNWRTFAGLSDPGALNFRVPDLRGLVPAGMDAMPGGVRANRMTRAVAITLAAKAGEETHIITIPEMPAHTHLPLGSGPTVGTTANTARAANNNSGATVTLLQPAGGGVAHENLQPTVFIPYIVCLDG